MCDPSHILLDCLSHTSPSDKAARLADVPAVVWPAVADHARELHVAPLLYHCLKPIDNPIMRPITETLREDYLKQALRAAMMYRDLAPLLVLLHQHDIPVILLKGAYLADAVYDNIALRGMCDVDLLCKKEHLATLESILKSWDTQATHAKGHSAEHEFHIAYALNGGLRVEVHWALHPPRQKYRVNPDDLWRRSFSTTIAGAPVLAMAHEDLLLHLCLHMSRNPQEMHLRMLCDIGMITRRYATRLDWQALASRARSWGFSRAVYLWLRLARDTLQAHVPEQILEDIKPVDFDERFLSLMHRKMLCNSATLRKMESINKLQSQKNLTGKFALLCRRLFLPRREMARLYHVPTDSWRVFPCYPVRIKDLVQRYGRIWWQLMRGEPKTIEAAAQPGQLNTLRDWMLSG